MTAPPAEDKPAPPHRPRSTTMECKCGGRLIIRVPGFATCGSCGLFYGVARVSLDAERRGLSERPRP